MAKKRANVLTPANSIRVLEGLIREGKLLAQDVARHLRIAELEDRLKLLRGGSVLPTTSDKPDRGTTRKKRAISAKGRESYQLQGKYIAYIRRFPRAERGKYQQIAKKNGREKAIAAMKKDLKAA